MLERVVSEIKVKVQFHLESGVVKLIRSRSADEDKTQSKYITDLVTSDMARHVMEDGD